MNQVVIARARSRNRQKRWGSAARVTLDDDRLSGGAEAQPESSVHSALDLAGALDRLGPGLAPPPRGRPAPVRGGPHGRPGVGHSGGPTSDGRARPHEGPRAPGRPPPGGASARLISEAVPGPPMQRPPTPRPRRMKEMEREGDVTYEGSGPTPTMAGAADWVTGSWREVEEAIDRVLELPEPERRGAAERLAPGPVRDGVEDLLAAIGSGSSEGSALWDSGLLDSAQALDESAWAPDTAGSPIKDDDINRGLGLGRRPQRELVGTSVRGVRHPSAGGPGRDGRGVPRRRPADRPAGGGEGAGLGGPRRGGAVRARAAPARDSPAPRDPETIGHGGHGGRASLLRDGVRAGRPDHSLRSGSGAQRRRARRAVRPALRRRPPRPRPPRRPPRHQAVERSRLEGPRRDVPGPPPRLRRREAPR